MLSKSQARNLFLTLTVGFSSVFVALTVDTLHQVKTRSHEDQLTPEVARGKALWEANNCMGCHTLFGEGAYYAPELTKVTERRSPEWMRTFLKDPEAMFPGKRKMVNYHFSDDEISDLIAFFSWIDHVDTNGFPKAPDMVVATASAAVNPDADRILAGAPDVVRTTCTSCHSIAGKGGNVGPALDHLSQRYDRAKLDTWLKDPPAVKPGTAMPNFHFPDDQRAQLVDWLLTLP